MTVNLDKLEDRIKQHKYSEWQVVTTDGPTIKDAYNNEVACIPVDHAVWTCDDEQDGCPEVAQHAVALAQLLCDLPEYALELIQAVRQLRWEVEHDP